jgi:hypothetical protein
MIRHKSSYWLVKPILAVAIFSSIGLANIAGAETFTSQDAQVTLGKMLSNEGISRGELNRFEAFIQSDRQSQFLTPEQAPGVSAAAERYGMGALADRIQRAYVSNDLTTAERIGSPPPAIRGNNLGEYLSGIHANADGSHAAKLNDAILTVYDRDGREMQVEDPVGGASIRNTALSCFYHSRRDTSATPNFGRYGTDVLELPNWTKTYRLNKQGREEEWTVDTFNVSHVVMDWEAAEGASFVGYVYGHREIKRTMESYRDRDGITRRQRQSHNVVEEPEWKRFSCGASSVVTDTPIYQPNYRRFGG